MGMSSHVVGFRPPDEKWKQMKAVYDTCTAAGIAVPDEVDDFFDNEPPDKAGVKIEEATLRKAGALKDWRDKEMREGFELDVTKLPAGLTKVVFYNSY